MFITKLTRLYVLGLAATAAAVQADIFFPTGKGAPGNWADPANWCNQTHSEKTGFPGAGDTAKISGGNMLTITSEVTVAYFKNGSDGAERGPATVIIAGGTLLASGSSEFNSVSYKCPSTLIVQNGGSATFNNRLLVGYQNFSGGELIIRDGTVRVANTFYHNEGYSETEPRNTRTTINPGGLLDVDELTLNSGVLDIAGGTLIIRRSAMTEVDKWVATGRMIAMGGKAGWKIKATVDDSTKWTTIVAEPVTEPFTVGALNPGVPARHLS